MKRNMFRLLLAAMAVPALLVACSDSDGGGGDYKIPSTVGFSNDFYTSVSVIREKLELIVLKSGEAQANVNIVSSAEVLDAYNLAHGTSYVALPAEHYSIAAPALSIAGNESSKTTEVSWDGEAIKSIDDGEEYVIALELTPGDDESKVSAIKNYVIIYPVAASLGFESTQVEAVSPKASGEVAKIEKNIVLNVPVEDVDVTINYAIDNTLIDAYNDANGTSYLPAPDGFVSMAAGSSVITAGKTSATFTCNINSGSLFTGNVLKAVDNNQYLVPIRITSLSSDAIKLGHDVMYIPVTMSKTVKGPWVVLEGQNNCYAMQSGVLSTAWYKNYITDRLFDGNPSTEWISWWDYGTNISFPMIFVLDMGESHVFTQFKIADMVPHHGNYRKFEIYTAEVYDKENTVWNLAADGSITYAGGAATYDYPPANGTFNMVAGRYLKFVIVEPVLTTGDCIYGRGKLSEVYGVGF